MATHDYVIANGTGAAVRSDLNDALAAIVSNNSGSSEPATTYAYQWWADTTANVLKIRNSANNAWITLRELDGTMLIEDGSASAPGLSFASDTNSGLFGGSDTIGFATGGAERLEIGSSEVVFNDPSNDVDFRVESNGQTHMLFVDAGNDRVGIATSSPGTDLDVNNGSANCTIRARTATGFSSFLNLLPNGSGTGVQLASNADSSSQLFNQLNGYLAFGTNNTERIRIENSGNLLIRRTANTDNGALCVDQDASGGNVAISTVTTSTATRYHNMFRNGNGQVGAISTNGSATTYATSSDYRLKENVVDLSGAITRVKQLAPKRFNFIVDAATTVDGFLAHEAQTVVPEAVTGTHNEVDDDGNAVMQGIDQSKLVPLLTAALQEAISKIETLETKVAALEAG